MATYQDIRQQVETLSASEQLRLLEELAALVRQDMALANQLANQAESHELTVAERLAQRKRVFLEGSIDSSEREIRKSSLYQHLDERQQARQAE
jgi:hypothetical protein